MKKMVLTERQKESCRKSGRKYRETHKESEKKRNIEWQKKNRKIISLQGREKYRKTKEEILSLLGSKCKRCGFSDIRALQIDHIEGGGNKALKNANNEYRRILKFLRENIYQNKYQLLCANCNWIKKSENKEGGKLKW